ncbi:hypothetical protein Tco_1006376 [Tanacetum coccineum]|uniref:Uncharacterized protein n=1 Tax=Tanacetum coccineum TaxID=301880 RepID=A0ABQ5FIJ4_9ASTR
MVANSTMKLDYIAVHSAVVKCFGSNSRCWCMDLILCRTKIHVDNEFLCTNLSNKVTSLEAELAQTKQTYGTALTKLIKKVKKLEQTVKSTQARRRFRIVVSDDEEGLEDPSKQGRKIIEIDQDPSISLVQDEGSLKV